MNLYLAGTIFYNGGGNLYSENEINRRVAARTNLLESYFYVKDWQTENIHNFKRFMLDSGAFSFVYGSKIEVNITEYFNRYKNYVRDNKVEQFFELDIDELVGYEKVLEYRRELEGYTQCRCIPVWHTNRGKNEWLRMCDEYDYVAIGGIADKGRKSIEKYIPWFTTEAHKRGTKVHGLGYTSLKNLTKMGFDSVDSSAWLYGNRGGFIYIFDGHTMQKKDVPEGKRMNAKAVAKHNFMEWVKFAEYHERQES